MNSAILRSPATTAAMSLQQVRKDYAGAETRGNILPLVLLWLTTLLPPQIRITAGIELFSYRICFIALIPFLIIQFSSGRVKLCNADGLIYASTVLMIIAMVYHNGPASGLISGLSVAADALAGYLLGRACIRSANDLRRALVVMAVPFLIAGGLVMIESLSHNLIVGPVVARYFSKMANGVTGSNLADYPTRLGLFRGNGAFPHPILAGLCLSSLIPLYALARIRSWPNALGRISGILAFFSVSSTAFMGMGLGLFLLAYNKVAKAVPAITWRALVIVAASVAAVAQTFAGGGILGVVARLSLDGTTGYYRYLLYIYGTKALASTPFLGIGDAQFNLPSWMRSGSVDSYWLLLSLRFGYVSSGLMLLCCFNIVFNLFRSDRQFSQIDRNIQRGLGMSIMIFVLGGFSVMLFGGPQIWFTILLGVAASIYSSSETELPTIPK